MKCALIADTVLLKKDDDYFGITLTYDFFKTRYLDKIDEITVVTREDNYAKHANEFVGYRQTNGKGVTVSAIKSYKKIPDFFIHRLSLKKELERIIAKTDKVIIRTPGVLGIIASKICKKYRKPYLVECVACAFNSYYYHTNPIGKLLAAPMYIACRKVVKNASHVLYVSNSFLQKRYPSEGKTCACSDVVLTSAGRSNPYHSSSNRPLRIYTVANVEMKYKGHLYVMRALKKCSKKGLCLNYYLIGNGDPERLIRISKKLGISQNVFFLGPMNHNAVLERLKDADIYVQPSLTEGLSRALVEAMSIGCPSIASNAGGNPELLEKEYIFKKKNTKQLVEKVVMLSTSSERLLASERNYKFSKNYSDALLSQKRDSFYRDYLGVKKEK